MDTTRIIFVILHMVACIQCYSKGPPISSKPELCDTMTPSHYGLQPQTGASPFSITVSNGVTSYKPGIPVSVTIGGTAFKGMFLQARKVDTNEIVGKFSSAPTDTKLDTCGQNDNNVVVHSNKTPKNNLVFTWNPPLQDVGQVEFVATIVQEKLTVWIKQKSTIKLTFEGREATTDSSSMESNEKTEGSEATTDSSSMASNEQTEGSGVTTDSSVTADEHTEGPDGENPDGENPDGGKKPGKNGVPLAGVSIAALAFTILAAVAVALF